MAHTSRSVIGPGDTYVGAILNEGDGTFTALGIRRQRRRLYRTFGTYTDASHALESWLDARRAAVSRLNVRRALRAGFAVCAA